MNIKITSDGTPTFDGWKFVNKNWYRGLTGKIYPVEREEKNEFYVITRDGRERWICKSHCKVIT